MTKTSIKKIKQNKCYCLIKKQDILLKDCHLFECSRWKKCMTKTNNDINKDLKGRKN